MEGWRERGGRGGQIQTDRASKCENERERERERRWWGGGGGGRFE